MVTGRSRSIGFVLHVPYGIMNLYSFLVLALIFDKTVFNKISFLSLTESTDVNRRFLDRCTPGPERDRKSPCHRLRCRGVIYDPNHQTGTSLISYGRIYTIGAWLLNAGCQGRVCRRARTPCALSECRWSSLGQAETWFGEDVP